MSVLLRDFVPILIIFLAGGACFESVLNTLRDPSTRTIFGRWLTYAIQTITWYAVLCMLANRAIGTELNSVEFYATFALWLFCWALHFYKLERGIARRSEPQAAIAE